MDEEKIEEVVPEQLPQEQVLVPQQPAPLPVQQPQLPIQPLPQPQPIVKDSEIKKKKTLWEGLWRKKKLKKKNVVAIMFLAENGNVETLEVKSENGFFNIRGKTYHERNDCTFTLGEERYPLAIIPEFHLTPLGTKEWEDKSMQEKCQRLQDHAMNGIRHAERVKEGERMGGGRLSGKAIVGIVIGAIVGLALLMNYL